MPDLDPYKELQVDPGADVEVIQAAYRRLARKYHPDLARDAAAADRMKVLNAAWEILRDPRRRATYDAQRGLLHGLPQRAGTPAAERGQGQGGTSRGNAASGGGAGNGRSDAAGRGSPGRAGDPRTTGTDPRATEAVSRDWTSGRSTTGGGYDPTTMRTAEGLGAAGPPPGKPSGSVLTFGRYAGWSLGEIARKDIGYVEWLDRVPIGRQYHDEIDQLLRRHGLRRSAEPQEERRGLFRRR